MLTQEIANEFFEYKDGNLYWKKKNATHTKIGSIVGQIDEYGYRRVGFMYRRLSVHRIIFLLHHGYEPKEVDHIDGNPSNNLIENLRAATRSEQLCNTKIRKNNKTGIKGVCWDKERQKWLVRINKNKKIVYQQRFDDFELAELVAEEARNKFHGVFANQG